MDMIVHQQHNSLGNHNYNAFFYDNCEWFYHFHKNYELIYILSGEVELTLNGTGYLLAADTLVVAPIAERSTGMEAPIHIPIIR